MGRPYSAVLLPGVKNYQFVEQRGQFPIIVIDQKGKAWMDGYELDDGPKAVIMIEDRMAELKCYKKKVFLKADEDIIYERVTRVMSEIQRAQVEIVGLVVHKRVAVE
jgi:biopolymer transport protein ExbD